jgi:hypothetical protein
LKENQLLEAIDLKGVSSILWKKFRFNGDYKRTYFITNPECPLVKIDF